MADEEAELAALRASSRFQQHAVAFGRAPPPQAAGSASASGASTSGSSGGGSIGVKSAAQRKVDALNAANRQWKAREEQEKAQASRDSDEAAGEKKRKTAHADAASSSAATAASSSHAAAAAVILDADDDDAPAVVSDASALEQSMLATFFPSSFGAAPKKGPDVAALNASHLRKQAASSSSSSSGVKIEGVESRPTQREDTQRPPRKPASTEIGIKPASLLGGGYDSSSDDEDDESKGSSASAAAASSSAAAAAAASSARSGAMSTDDEDADSSDDEANGGARPNPLLRTLPISHEVELKTNGHTKTVSALAVDKAGGRVLSGGYDYQAKLWDFGGMNESLAAFRTLEPQEGHQVRSLVYSATGDMFLAVTGGSQAKIYSRDAAEICTFARGDMYIMDQRLTKGHSTAITSGWWHPTDRNTVLTSGIDGTLRIWDVNNPTKNVAVIKPRGIMRGVGVSATAFSRDGKIIAAGLTDGSIHLLKHSKGADYRDDKVLAGAHAKSTSSSTALLFSADGHSLFSRGGEGDHTVKQWDIRAFKQPVSVLADLENSYPETDLAFSPDEKILVTGTSSTEHNTQAGHAVFIERATMKPIQRVSMGCKSVVRSVWHAGINQLLFGCSDGAIRLLYDPQLSHKGVLQCIGRRAKPKPSADFDQVHIGAIQTPHALPSMRGDESKSRKRAREKTAESMVPEKPVQGRHGVGGRAAGSQSMAAFHLSKHIAMKVDPREKDPREALLAMDALAKADPLFFGNAYKVTQPTTILAEVPEDERFVALTQAEVELANKKEGSAKKY